jgi:hypothetical protein
MLLLSNKGERGDRMKPTKKTVKISDLNPGPIQHEVLPDGFIDRIRNFKQILIDVDETSLEEAVSNFQRDARPERELALWEHLAEKYQVYITRHDISSVEVKKEVFRVLFGFTLGEGEWPDLKFITDDEQIQELKSLYDETAHE